MATVSQVFPNPPDRTGDIGCCCCGCVQTSKDAFSCCPAPRRLIVIVLVFCEAPGGRQAAPQEKERAAHRRLYASEIQFIGRSKAALTIYAVSNRLKHLWGEF